MTESTSQKSARRARLPVPVSDEDVRDQWQAVEWGVERSMRYHMRRQGFFDRWHRINGFVSLLFSSAAVVGVLSTAFGNGVVAASAAVAAIFGALDLLVSPAMLAREHHELRRRFAALARKMNGATPNHRDLIELVNERLTIEEDEPPIFRALDLLCHNELSKARGYDNTHDGAICEIGLRQKLTAHWLRWEGI